MDSDFGGLSRPRPSSARLASIASVGDSPLSSSTTASASTAAAVVDYYTSPLATTPLSSRANVAAGGGPPSSSSVAAVISPRSSISAFSGSSSSSLGIASLASSSSSRIQLPPSSSSTSISQSQQQANAPLHPPSGFSIIEPGLVYRAVLPLGSSNLAFLQPFGISVVLILDEVPLTGKLATYCQQAKIQVRLLPLKVADPEAVIEEFDGYIKGILTTLLSSLPAKPVLIVGSAADCYDIVVAGCLRRLQGWSVTSVIGEMRQLAQRSNYDLEQYVESCDLTALQPLASQVFAYTTLEDDIFGRKLDGEELEDITTRKKYLYEKLFVRPSRTSRLTAGLEFDHNLSLVTGEAEDDD